MKNNLTNIWRKIFFDDKNISPPVSELTYWPVWIWSEEKRIMVPVWDQNILRFYSFISVHIPAKIKEKLNMRFHIMYRVMKGGDFRFSKAFVSHQFLCKSWQSLDHCVQSYTLCLLCSYNSIIASFFHKAKSKTEAKFYLKLFPFVCFWVKHGNSLFGILSACYWIILLSSNMTLKH